MKKLISYGISFFLILSSAQKISAQANTELSNLVSPVKVNVDFTPDKDNKRDLGKTTKTWKDLYISGIMWREGYTWLAGRFYSGNTFVGQSAGYTLIASGEGTSQNNTFMGSNAGFSNTTGVANTFIGMSAGYSNTTGGGNVFLGQSAGNDNTTGQSNTFLGIQAGTRNTTGRNNVMIGEVAGGFTKTGNSNVFVGNQSGYLNSSGSYNTYIGDSAGRAATASYNTIIGSKSGAKTTTGGYNTLVGVESMSNNTTGFFNTSLGYFTMDDNTNADYNTAIGYSTGTLFSTGSNNTFLGFDADVSIAGIENSTVLGSGARATASNQVRIGNFAVTSIGGYANWTNISDGRYKKNIKQNVPGLQFINKLKPVTYNLDIIGIENKLSPVKEGNADDKNEQHAKAIEKKQKEIQTGFIAQDVEKIAKEMGFEFSGVDAPENENGLYGLRYAEFVVPLVKAVQELSKMNDEKDALIAEMMERLSALENQSGTTSKSIAGNDTQSITLSQNIPNPFNATAVINYFVPQNASNAQLVITDAGGHTIKKMTLTTKGASSTTISSNDLGSGSYFYQLIVDGKKYGSKKMTVIK